MAKVVKSIRFTEELLARVDALARERNTSRTEVVEWALQRWLDSGEEFVARGDARTISGRMPIAPGAELPVAAVKPGVVFSRRAESPAMVRQREMNKAKGL